MIKGITVAAVLTGALLVGPAAPAAQADPIGTPGYGLEHAGHDHGPMPEEPAPGKHHDKDGDRDHDRHSGKKHGHDDSAHAEGGYDSHRSHPRNW
jgi:hypothetical protein